MGENTYSDEEEEDDMETQLRKRDDEYFKNIIALGQKIIEENEDKPFWSTGIIGRHPNPRNGDRRPRKTPKHPKK